MKTDDVERVLRRLGWCLQTGFVYSGMEMNVPRWLHGEIVSVGLPDPNDPLIRAQATDWLLERHDMGIYKGPDHILIELSGDVSETGATPGEALLRALLAVPEA